MCAARSSWQFAHPLAHPTSRALPGRKALPSSRRLQHAFDLAEARPATLKRLQRPLAVRDLGCRHSHHVRQALRVHHDMALDAGGLSARVIAFKPCRVRALHAMRVNDEKAATGVAPLFLAARANLIFSKPAPAGLVFRAARSGYSVRVHGAAPLRKVLGLHAPLEATPEQVEHCAKHLVEVNPPWAGLLARTPQQRLDDLKLRSADIARMALSPPPTPSHASMGDFEHALSAVVHAAPKARGPLTAVPASRPRSSRACPHRPGDLQRSRNHGQRLLAGAL